MAQVDEMTTTSNGAPSKTLDGAQIISAQKSRFRSTEVQLQGDLEPVFDLALMTVTDVNGVNPDLYSVNREEALENTARRGVQLLVNRIFALPTKYISAEGVFAILPKDVLTVLPREKPLPKIKKEATKWEQFAKSKGIAPKAKRDKLIYDEEKQEWVPRWGYKGANKDKEEQWIYEVPANQDANYDPIKAAKDERKARKLKNEGQRLKNLDRAKASALKAEARSRPRAAIPVPSGLAALEASQSAPPQSRDSRKSALQRQLKSTKFSTASLGKFDAHLDNEAKIAPDAVKAADRAAASQGRKRKFDSNEITANGAERERAMKILKTVGKEDPKAKAVRLNRKDNKGQIVDSETGGALVNARKAIRTASRGRGAAALSSRGSSKGRGGSRGGKGRGK